MEDICAIILAAGKGSRMKLESGNKVTTLLKGIPLITRIITILESAQIKNIIVVVGHEKESVLAHLKPEIITVEQKELLGTADAVKTALTKVPASSQHIFVLNGDDAFFLTTDMIQSLHNSHIASSAAITFLTVKMSDSTGLGRVVRQNGKVVKIVEEKDATDSERSISEVNAACYMFNKKFLDEKIEQIQKSKITGEYYIIDLVAIASTANLPIETVEIKDAQWRGINTKEDLQKAEAMNL